MQKMGSQFGADSEEKQQREKAKQKTIEAMAITDKKATVCQGHCVCWKNVLQMRSDKTHAIHQQQMRKGLKISHAKWHHHAKEKTTAVTLANHWKISFCLGPTCGKDNHDCTMKDIHASKKSTIGNTELGLFAARNFQKEHHIGSCVGTENTMKHLNVLSSGNMTFCIVTHP